MDSSAENLEKKSSCVVSPTLDCFVKIFGGIVHHNTDSPLLRLKTSLAGGCNKTKEPGVWPVPLISSSRLFLDEIALIKSRLTSP